jgi:hypothetical protein
MAAAKEAIKQFVALMEHREFSTTPLLLLQEKRTSLVADVRGDFVSFLQWKSRSRPHSRY